MTLRPSDSPGCPNLPNLARPLVPTLSLMPWALPDLPNLFRARMRICKQAHFYPYITHSSGRLGRLGQRSNTNASRCPNLDDEVGQVGTAACFTGIGVAARHAPTRNPREAVAGGRRVGSSPGAATTGNSDRACRLFSDLPKGVK